MTKPWDDPDLRDALSVRVFGEIAAGRLTPALTNEQGRQTIVVGFENEPLSAVTQRVVLSGESANVFIEMNDRTIEELTVRSTKKYAASPLATDLGPVPIKDDVEIGLMIAWAAEHPDGVVARIQLPQRVSEFEYIETEELQPA